MKKTTARILSLIVMLQLLSLSVYAESGSWVCPACGQTVSTLFCANDGTKRPESEVADNGEWECPKCGNVLTTEFCPDDGTKRTKSGGEDSSDDPISIYLNGAPYKVVGIGEEFSVSGLGKISVQSLNLDAEIKVCENSEKYYLSSGKYAAQYQPTANACCTVEYLNATNDTFGFNSDNALPVEMSIVFFNEDGAFAYDATDAGVNLKNKYDEFCTSGGLIAPYERKTIGFCFGRKDKYLGEKGLIPDLLRESKDGTVVTIMTVQGQNYVTFFRIDGVKQ